MRFSSVIISLVDSNRHFSLPFFWVILSLALCSFFTNIHWSVLCRILRGPSIGVWGSLCVALPSLTLCPVKSSIGRGHRAEPGDAIAWRCPQGGKLGQPTTGLISSVPSLAGGHRLLLHGIQRLENCFVYFGQFHRCFRNEGKSGLH